MTRTRRILLALGGMALLAAVAISDPFPPAWPPEIEEAALNPLIV